MRAPWLWGMLAVLATGCLHRPPGSGLEAKVADEELELLEETLAGAKARYAASVRGPPDARIDRASWEVRYDGRVVDRGSQALAVPFGSDGVAALTLVVPVPYARTAAELTALNGEGGKVKLELEGRLHLTRATAEGEREFSSAIRVAPPHLPSIRLLQVDGARFHTGEGQVALTLEVHNPNAFPIVISEAPYLVGLADQPGTDGVAFAGQPLRPDGNARYPIRVYLDPPSEDPDDGPRPTQIRYLLKGALRGTLYDVPFVYEGTATLRPGR